MSPTVVVVDVVADVAVGVAVEVEVEIGVAVDVVLAGGGSGVFEQAPAATRIARRQVSLFTPTSSARAATGARAVGRPRREIARARARARVSAVAVLIPTIEKLGRFALNRRGLASRFVATSVGRIHAYDGKGRGALAPVVVIHGIGSAATPFGAVLARLQRHARRVIAPELPGHGFSEPPRSALTPEVLFDAMREALDALVDEPAVVCGNSLGGALALRFALDRPERVRALVLVSPAGARISPDELDALKRTFDLGSRREAAEFLGRLFHRKPWFAPLLAGEIREMMRRRAVRDILEGATPEHGPSPDELASLKMPVLLLWGRSERLLSASALAYFRRHLPGHAIVEEPEGLGHCPHFDDPVALSERIARFARQATTA
jgi:pimeloyl-ACP methyl ester carboxylesterase